MMKRCLNLCRGALAGFLITAIVPQALGLKSSIVPTEKARILVETVTRGLEHPWGIAFLPDEKILITERVGRLRVLENGRLRPRPVDGLPSVTARGQGGLLDVTLHPNFSENYWVYASYVSSGQGGIGTEVARGRWNGRDLEDVRTIFRLQPKSRGGRHFGSRLVFDRDGYLYVTLGDRGDRPRAQRLDDHAGSVPQDNPFVDDRSALPEIYSFGNRNVQGAALHPVSGELWTHEHGPQGGDEINIIRAGTNYGWPVITYGVNYGFGTQIGVGTEKPGMAQPLYYWDPSIAPSGMTFYDADRLPAWRGNLFVGSLKFATLVRLELDGERITHEERLLTNRLGRIRDVRTGPDGLLYLLTDADDGLLVRLSPAPTDKN